MKRCCNICVVKAELERVWNHKAIGFLSISNICPLFIMAAGVVERKPNFQLCILIFHRKIRPWEIFALPCLPTCWNTGVIRIHFKTTFELHLNGIWQHSESFIKNRLCQVLSFPEAPTGPHHQQKGNEMIHSGESAVALILCLVPNCAWWQVLPLSAAAPLHRLQSISFSVSSTCSQKGIF